MSPSTLDQLLDEDQTFDPVTADGLSNHLSMGLIGLGRLGANDDQLRRFADSWRPRLLARRPKGTPINFGDWQASLGTGRRYGDLLECFSEAIAADGVDSTLDRVLAPLAEGIGGAAFHGIIRLAYALEHGRDSDIACGLACLADVHDPVGPLAGAERQAQPGMTFAAVLASLAQNPHTAGRPRGSGTFSDDFHRVATDPSFREVIDQLTIDATTLEQVVSSAHALYRSSHDFFALHTVTGSHAARIVIERLSDANQKIVAAGALARAVAAAYVVIGTPAVKTSSLDPNVSDSPTWPAIASAAIASEDVHTIKMTYSCREEELAWGKGAYHVTAAEVVGLL